MHFRNLGGGHYWTIELRDLQFVAFVTSSSRNEIRIHTKYTFLCDEYQSRRREAPVLLWLLFCLMSQKKGAPLHSFLCILHFSKLHSWYSWFFREKTHMKKASLSNTTRMANYRHGKCPIWSQNTTPLHKRTIKR